MAFQTDIWRVALVKAPIEAWQNKDYRPREDELILLPKGLLNGKNHDFCFHADPFGILHDGFIHIFSEYYDYREKKGKIHHFLLNHDFEIEAGEICLEAPYHLSYPYIFQWQNEIYMMPEMYRATQGKNGGLAQKLYKGVFHKQSWRFQEVKVQFPDKGLIDPSLCEWDDKFWLFYSKPAPDDYESGRKRGREYTQEQLKSWPLRALYLAFADSPLGPWQDHPLNPILTGLDGARMGGTPFTHNGRLYLPCQNSEHSYGNGLRLWQVEAMNSHEFKAIPHRLIAPEGLAGYHDGLHNLSQCGDFSLIDLKRIDTSSKRRWINMQRRFSRLFKRL